MSQVPFPLVTCQWVCSSLFLITRFKNGFFENEQEGRICCDREEGGDSLVSYVLTAFFPF